jgi:hypothetical protein
MLVMTEGRMSYRRADTILKKTSIAPAIPAAQVRRT